MLEFSLTPREPKYATTIKRTHPDNPAQTQERVLDVSPEELAAFEAGVPIGYAMPRIHGEDAEFVMTGRFEYEVEVPCSTRHRLGGKMKVKEGLPAPALRDLGVQYHPYWFDPKIVELIKKLDPNRKARLPGPDGDVQPLRENPRFLQRTDRKYGRVPLTDFAGRAGMSIMLESLTAFLPEGAVIAGGFMQQVVQDCLATTEPVLIQEESYWAQTERDKIEKKARDHRDQKDIDIFFTSERAFRETIELLVDPPSDKEAWMWQGYELVGGLDESLKQGGDDLRHVTFESGNGRPDLQLIKLAWYEDAEHVIDTFDFTCVQFATDGKDLIMNPLGVFDLARKRLVLHRMQFPASTLRRLLKYSQKGFYACPGALAKIAEEVGKAYAEGVKDGEEFVYLD